jgi:hypothetical protein
VTHSNQAEIPILPTFKVGLRRLSFPYTDFAE